MKSLNFPIKYKNGHIIRAHNPKQLKIRFMKNLNQGFINSSFHKFLKTQPKIQILSRELGTSGEFQKCDVISEGIHYDSYLNLYKPKLQPRLQKILLDQISDCKKNDCGLYHGFSFIFVRRNRELIIQKTVTQ